MPTYRFIDYNELTSKPDVVDMFAIYDIDANELKKFPYATLKSFFVKTDEPSDVEATIEFQSTATKPNSLLKFGSAGEFRFYSDGTDLFMKGTNASGKLRFYANSVEMFTLNPTNSSIAIQGNAINKDGTAGVGINFDSSNRPVLLSVLQCDAGIAMKTQNISYNGTLNTGLEFSASNIAYFMQQLTCNGLFEIAGKMKTNGNWISYSGTVNKGIRTNIDNSVECSDDLSCGGVFSAIQGIGSDGNITAQGSVYGFNDGGGKYLKLEYGTSTPATIIGSARIWVDPTNAVMIRHSNGTIQTFSLT